MKRQPSETNQSVRETEDVPEIHSYQEGHFQPSVNESVPEDHFYSEFGESTAPDNDAAMPSGRVRHSDATEDSGGPDTYGHNGAGARDDYSRYSVRDAGTESAISSSISTATTAAAVSSSTVASVMVTAAAVVIIAAAVLVPLISETPSSIIYEQILTTDSSIYYQIFFEDYEEGMDITVSLHNNFTNRTFSVTSERAQVTEWGLKPDMEYTITVMGPMSVTLSERTVKTAKTSADPVLVMNHVEFDAADGKIHYYPTVSDPKGAWSDFYASLYLKNADGSLFLVASEHVENMNEEHALAFSLQDQQKHEAVFTIECTEGGESRTLYRSEPITVFNIPYYGVTHAILDEVADTYTIGSEIIDPGRLRSGYTAYLTITNASDPSQTYAESKAVSSGSDTVFTNVSHGFAFYGTHLEIRCTQTDTSGGVSDVTLYSDDAEVYRGPAVSVTSATFTDTNRTGTVNMAITDIHNEWTNLTAKLEGNITVEDLEGEFDNTQTAVTFDLSGSSLMLNEEITFRLYSNGVAIPGTDTAVTIDYDYMSSDPVVTFRSGTTFCTINADIVITDPWANDYADYELSTNIGGTAYSVMVGTSPTTSVNTLSIFGAAFHDGDVAGYIITRTYGGTSQIIYTGSVTLHDPPTATIISQSFSNMQGVVRISIDDQYGQWTNLSAKLLYTSPEGDMREVSSTEYGFDSTQTSVTFNMMDNAGLLGEELMLVLFDGSDEAFDFSDRVVFVS